MKLTKIGNNHSETIKKVAQIIPDDGFADGGTPYTGEEMGIIDRPDVNETDIIGALSYAKEHVMAADWQGALKALERATVYVEKMMPAVNDEAQRRNDWSPLLD